MAGDSADRIVKAVRITTCQARNTFQLTAEIAAYLQQKLNLPFEYINDIGWPERYQQIDNGRMDIGWICGWPYVVRADQPDSQIELLVAPVMTAERYQQRPIYYSDVIVRRDRPYKQFLDLRHGRWAFNEPGSQSGCHIVRYHLSQIGEMDGFFDTVVASGGHVNSIEMVRAGRVDGAAIDSTVWDWEVAHRPELLDQLKVVAQLGPSGMPPWVIQKAVPQEIRAAVREALLSMHKDARGQALLTAAQVSHFAAVTDTHYNDVREMGRVARSVRLAANDGYYRMPQPSSVEANVIC